MAAPRTIPEIEAEIAATNTEIETLRATIAEGKKAEARLRILCPWRSDEHATVRLAAELARARLAEADKSARAVVFVASHGYHGLPTVVAGVTDKWITVRRAGSPDADTKYAVTDGRCFASYRSEVLDLAATFPEGVAAYRKATR